MSFNVVASRAISSPVDGTSSRWRTREPPMAETRARMRSTGDSARPTSSQVATPTSTTRAGRPTSSSDSAVRTDSCCAPIGAATTTRYRWPDHVVAVTARR